MANCPNDTRAYVGGIKRAYYDMVQRVWDEELKEVGTRLEDVGHYSLWRWYEIKTRSK
jgi:hypothetical protein